MKIFEIPSKRRLTSIALANLNVSRCFRFTECIYLVCQDVVKVPGSSWGLRGSSSTTLRKDCYWTFLNKQLQLAGVSFCSATEEILTHDEGQHLKFMPCFHVTAPKGKA